MRSKLLLILTFLIISFSGFSQSGSVSGRVIDEKTKEPVMYANIKVEQELLGTMTDDRGLFSISNLNTNSNLIFSCIGYKSKTINVNELSNKTVVKLAAEPRNLAEVTIVGRTAKSIIKEVLSKIKENYHTSNLYLQISYAQIGTNEDSVFFMTYKNGIYKHKGYDNRNIYLKPLRLNMQTLNKEYINFNIDPIDEVAKLNYLKLRPKSFEYSMDITYDGNTETSYIITIKHKDSKPFTIPLYVSLIPRILKLYINPKDFAITRIESTLDTTNQETNNFVFYKQKFINLYFVCNYTKIRDKYAINNAFLKNVTEITPKRGFEETKRNFCIDKGIIETKILFNVNNVYFSDTTFNKDNENIREVKSKNELKDIDELKILLMEDREFLFD